MESDSNAREDIAVLIVLALDSRSAGFEVNLAVSGCQRLYRVSFMDFGTFSIQVCMVESILEGQFVLL